MSNLGVNWSEDGALEDALVTFVGCLGEAFPDICSYGLTIGETYVPFNPDPEDDCSEFEDEEEASICSQVWVRVAGINPSPRLTEEGFNGEECVLTLRMTLECGIYRCIEVEERGEAPKASTVLAASLQAMRDMQAMHKAASECEVWDAFYTGGWVPRGPMGQQYGGQWLFDVEFSIPTACD